MPSEERFFELFTRVEQSAAEPATAEPVEPRAGTKGNADQQSTCRAQSRVSVSQALDRIRKVAKERKKEKLTALFHHISIDLLEEAFYELKENAAPGVDRLTWKDYEAGLERKLEDLHDRVHRGAYRALPSRRVYIPKPAGRQRPAGTRHARCAGCALCRDPQQEGELDTGRRHPIVLRHGEPGMAHPVRGASDRRPAHHPPDPQVAQGGRHGRWDRDRQ